jgi:hypothetical protein
MVFLLDDEKEHSGAINPQVEDRTASVTQRKWQHIDPMAVSNDSR